MSTAVTVKAAGIEGKAVLPYVPRSRGSAHVEDSVSQALLRFHEQPRLDWADLYARLMQHALPIAVDTLTFPPARTPSGWSAGRALADALSRLAGIPCVELLFWGAAGAGGWRDRAISCPQGLSTRRIVVVDDIWNTGATMIKCGEALRRAGATSASALCLGYVTSRERTADDIQRDQGRAREALDTVGAGQRIPTRAEFLAAVSSLPDADEAHASPVSQQLWRASFALNAYAQWSMENLEGAATFASLAGQADPVAQRLQALADEVLAALRHGPFAAGGAQPAEAAPLAEGRLRMVAEE